MLKRTGFSITLVLGCADSSPDAAGSSSEESGATSDTSSMSSTSDDPTTADTTAAATSTGSLDTTSDGSESSGTSTTGVAQPTCPPTGPDDVGVLDEALLVDSERIVISESDTVIENVHVHGDIE